MNQLSFINVLVCCMCSCPVLRGGGDGGGETNMSLTSALEERLFHRSVTFFTNAG